MLRIKNKATGNKKTVIQLIGVLDKGRRNGKDDRSGTVVLIPVVLTAKVIVIVIIIIIVVKLIVKGSYVIGYD